MREEMTVGELLGDLSPPEGDDVVIISFGVPPEIKQKYSAIQKATRKEGGKKINSGLCALILLAAEKVGV